jgi:hypothetical protein
MEGYGIELLNGSRELIISAVGYNFNYGGLGTVVSANEGGLPSTRTLGIWEFQIQSATAPLCFIEGTPSSYYSLVQLSQNGTTWTAKVVGFPISRPNLHFFVQVPPGQGLANPFTYGIAVWDPASNVAMDSERKPLDPAQVAIVNTPSCGDDGSTNRLCVGLSSTYVGAMPNRAAFMFASRGRAQLSRGNQDYKRFAHIARINGNNVDVTWGMYALFGLGGGAPRTFDTAIEPNSIVIIDVDRLG